MKHEIPFFPARHVFIFHIRGISRPMFFSQGRDIYIGATRPPAALLQHVMKWTLMTREISHILSFNNSVWDFNLTTEKKL